MDAELKQRWVQALRSGKYAQGRNVLKNRIGHDTQYCCLGVLCELLGGEWEVDHNGRATYDGEIYQLTPAVLEQAQIKANEQEKLIQMNDMDRATFDTIADYIEKNL